MTSTLPAAGSLQSFRSSEVRARLLSVAWLSSTVALVAIALFLAWRRASGALTEPLAASGITAIAVVLELMTAMLRLSLPRTLQLNQRFVFALPGAAAIVMLAALTLRGTSPWGLSVAWLLLITAEVASWWMFLNPPRIAPSRRLLPIEQLAGDVEETAIPTGLIQQMTRVAEGTRESIHALAQVTIPANERQAAMHFAFCPPLGSKPDLTAHSMDESDADVRITQAETFGVRLEVRVARLVEGERRVVIELIGSAEIG